MATHIGSSTTDTTERWSIRNSEKISGGLKITGITLGALAIGLLVTACTISSYQDFLTRSIDIYVAGSTILSIVFLVASCIWAYKHPASAKPEQITSEEAKIKSDAKKWRMIALMIGIILIGIGIGMIAGSCSFKAELSNIRNADLYGPDLMNWINQSTKTLNILFAAGSLSAIAGGGLLLLGGGYSYLKEKWKLSHIAQTSLTPEEQL